MSALKLMAVLAHPDDESLGTGGTLAKYAAQGVETSLVTATRGERGRYHGHPTTAPEHPGPRELGRIREQELRAAAAALGIHDLSLLDYEDQHLDRAPHAEAVAQIVSHLRRARPQVVLTFGPEGAYGHPDHIAICQFTTAAIVAAADASYRVDGADATPHRVAKLYYIAWDEPTWSAYQSAFQKLVSTVDGVGRQATAWPSWAITTVIDTRAEWPTVWRAVSCHASQIGGYNKLATLAPEHHEALWGTQSYYRVFSLVSGGRQRETDLFEGLR